MSSSSKHIDLEMLKIWKADACIALGVTSDGYFALGQPLLEPEEQKDNATYRKELAKKESRLFKKGHETTRAKKSEPRNTVKVMVPFHGLFRQQTMEDFKNRMRPDSKNGIDFDVVNDSEKAIKICLNHAVIGQISDSGEVDFQNLLDNLSVNSSSGAHRSYTGTCFTLKSDHHSENLGLVSYSGNLPVLPVGLRSGFQRVEQNPGWTVHLLPSQKGLVCSVPDKHHHTWETLAYNPEVTNEKMAKIAASSAHNSFSYRDDIEDHLIRYGKLHPAAFSDSPGSARYISWSEQDVPSRFINGDEDNLSPEAHAALSRDIIGRMSVRAAANPVTTNHATLANASHSSSTTPSNSTTSNSTTPGIPELRRTDKSVGKQRQSVGRQRNYTNFTLCQLRACSL